MACPTCDHTMQNVGATTDRIFWCPRCGTLSTYTGEHREDEPSYWMKRADRVIFAVNQPHGDQPLTVRELGER